MVRHFANAGIMVLITCTVLVATHHMGEYLWGLMQEIIAETTHEDIKHICHTIWYTKNVPCEGKCPLPKKVALVVKYRIA